jgi:hypothetical protein
MTGKSREPREAAKLPKKSVKVAPTTVVRAAAAPDPRPNDEDVKRAAAADENNASGPATLTPYERMKKVFAAKEDRIDAVAMDTVEGMLCFVHNPIDVAATDNACCFF